MRRHALCACLAVLALACDDGPSRVVRRPEADASALVPERSSGSSAHPAADGGDGGEPLPEGREDDEGRDAAAAPPLADDAALPDAADDRRSLAARLCPATGSAESPLPAQASASLLRDGFGFLEGPVWLESQGVLLFSDMDFAAEVDQGPPARIMRLRPPMQFDMFAEQANSNGLALDTDGSVVGCSQDVQSLTRFDPVGGTRTPLELRYLDHRFNSPNDLTVRSDGTIYFTDPDWQLGTRTSETGITGVYRVDPAGVVWLVDEQLDRPNGIALSPDERTLYVGSAGEDVIAYAVSDDGGVGERRVFASPGASDGMTVDCAGNLYVTGGSAVHVFAPEGSALGQIAVAGEPSNVAFGGADRRTLYITAGEGLYAIELAIPGLPY